MMILFRFERAMKTCFKCGAVKPLSDFYKHPKMGDGHLGKVHRMHEGRCATTLRRASRGAQCVRGAPNANAEHREERSAYEARRTQTPERKAALHEGRRLHRKRHPDRAVARQAVNNAIARGHLVRSACVECGSTEYVQAHHEDYSKPLEVEWLCFRCHRKRHGQIVVSHPKRMVE
jgi:hypothetical protein